MGHLPERGELQGSAAQALRDHRRLIGFLYFPQDAARPQIVEAGDTITYTLDVTNPGRVSFPAGGVDVTDSRCDHQPDVVAKRHLDDANRYMEIFNANKDLLKDPDKILPGQRLVIPRR